MRTIVRIKFGSHLYGTATPSSDVDYKSVHIPDARDILLQRAKGSISNARPKQSGEKNYAGEVDEESYSLHRFLQLASEGQTVALDVLFAPDFSMVGPTQPEWNHILANRHRLLTKKSAAFLGYCRQQANKYGIKGSRVSAARGALTVISNILVRHPPSAKLGLFEDKVREATTEHSQVVPLPQADGKTILFWEVCGRKLSFTASLKEAHSTLQRLVDEYGQRAIQAENQQGVDWKALSHAVRVGNQALELLRTGHVTFPLPNAKHILDIKLGTLPYQGIAKEIEDLLVSVEQAAESSTLPDSPDMEWIDNFVCSVYAKEVATL